MITGTLRIVLWYQVTDVIGTRTGKHVAMTARVVPGPDWVTLEGEVRGRTMAGTCTTDDETEVWEVTRVN